MNSKDKLKKILNQARIKGAIGEDIDYDLVTAQIEALITEARIDELAKFGYASFKFVIPDDGLRYDHIDPYIIKRIAQLRGEKK